METMRCASSCFKIGASSRRTLVECASASVTDANSGADGVPREDFWRFCTRSSLPNLLPPPLLMLVLMVLMVLMVLLSL